MKQTPGLAAFIKEFTRERTWGERGYLAQKGLIPLPKAERRATARKAKKKEKLTF